MYLLSLIELVNQGLRGISQKASSRATKAPGFYSLKEDFCQEENSLSYIFALLQSKGSGKAVSLKKYAIKSLNSKSNGKNIP